MKNTVQLHTASNIANGIIANALESGRVCGANWPHEYEFAIVKRYSTWPCGWMPEVYVSFYVNEAEFNEALKLDEDFMKCEDNYLARRAYRWDWGPEEIAEHAINAYRVPTKPSSYDRVCVGDLWKWNDAVNAVIANHRKAATPQEFNATQYAARTEHQMMGVGPWPFEKFEMVAQTPLFIAAPELKRVTEASKDVDENAPIVLPPAPPEVDSNNYWF
jgi:hypothetical protein